MKVETKIKEWYWLCRIPEVGNASIRKMLKFAGDVEEIRSLTEDHLIDAGIKEAKIRNAFLLAKGQREEAIEEYDLLKEKGIQFYCQESEEYPEKFRQLSDAPFGIWVKGKLPDPEKPAAAIIGSRICTDYGREMASVVGEYLASIGVCVISGMAKGIDGCGQNAALRQGGYSLGVLASGVDVCYPAENYMLYRELTQKGGILSENPLGQKGFPYLFPMRNRLISSLSDCIIVIEAKEKSGTQITVNCALEQGKDVYALPGRLTDPFSKGCNQMISQGAYVLYDLKELAEYFHKDAEESREKEYRKSMTSEESMVYNVMSGDMMHFEELLEKTGILVGDLTRILFQLEIKEWVVQPEKNYYRRTFA